MPRIHFISIWSMAAVQLACAPFGSHTQPDAPKSAVASDHEGSCEADPISNRGDARVVKSGSAQRAAALLATASAHLEAAVTEYNNTPVVSHPERSRRPRITPWPPELAAAHRGYQQALRVAPDSVDGTLGLGLVFVVAAHREVEDDNARRGYISAAKKYLGQAFLMGQGQYEPLYFLADLAILEADYNRAARFLALLQKAGERRAEVAMSLGYIAEQRSTRELATQWYAQALQLAPSAEALPFLAQQLKGTP